jgi:prepilin signal peptidase PulO-like enzyme (type II secretory pathway)
MVLYTVMVIITLIVLGLCLGSFINAFVWRHYRAHFYAEDHPAQSAKPKKAKNVASQPELTKDQLSIVKGRSMCTHCYHELSAKDLIPVVSYSGCAAAAATAVSRYRTRR